MKSLGLAVPRGLTRSIAALADEPAPRWLLHGDFHPNNVLYTASGPVVIDWSFASAGDPLLDVARTLVLPVIAEALVRPLGLLRGLVDRRLETFLDAYAEAAGGLDRQRLRHWQRVVLAAAAADAQANALSGAGSASAAKEQAIARHLLQAGARLSPHTATKKASGRPVVRAPSLRGKRVLFCLAGTTGDVLPGLTLAAGAASAGAEVTVATHATFQTQVERLGLRFAPLPGSHEELFETSTGALLRSTRGRRVAHAAGSVAFLRSVQPELFDAFSALAIADNDLLVYNSLCAPLQYFADAEGVPGIVLHYQTAFPTGRHGSPYVSAPTSSVPALNKLSHDLSLQIEGLLVSPSARKEAKRHGIETPRRQGLLLAAWKRAALHVQAVSPWLCRSVPISPFEEVRTGFLGSPGGAFQPVPDEVLAAHDAGRRLVYFGVGSLASGDNRKLAQRLHKAVAERGGLLVTDRPVGDLLDGDAEAVSAAGVGHDDLFPLMSAAVIVGGAGTMSTALRAGTPMIVLPHWFDQFAWQFLLTEEGLAAPDTPALGRWDKTIAAGLDWAVLPETKARLSEAAAIVKAEDSTAAGAAALASVLAGPR
jgi:vancomycin aglycone glucosyltransferase